MPTILIGHVDYHSTGHCLFGGLSLPAEFNEVMTALWRKLAEINDDLSEQALLDKWAPLGGPPAPRLDALPLLKNCRDYRVAIANGRRLEDAAVSGELLVLLTKPDEKLRWTAPRDWADPAEQDLIELLDEHARPETRADKIPGVRELVGQLSDSSRRSFQESIYHRRCLAEFLRNCGGIRLMGTPPPGVGCVCTRSRRYRWLSEAENLDPELHPLYGVLSAPPLQGLFRPGWKKPLTLPLDFDRANERGIPFKRDQSDPNPEREDTAPKEA